MDWGAVIGAGAIIPLLNAGIRLAVPTGLAAVGETLCQRAGVLNLSLEGMMLTGALGAFLGAHYSGNLWVGVIVGVLSGMSIGVLMAFLSVTLKTEQVINGIVLVLLAQGATGFIFEELFGVTTPVRFDPMTTAKIPLLGEIPGVGTVLFNQTPLVYLSVALVATIWWILYRTRFGLAVRAAGDRPAATDAAGIKVDHVRWIALLVSGAMAGLGGAVLVVGQLGLFVQNVSAGRGVGCHSAGDLRPVEPAACHGGCSAVWHHRCPPAAHSGGRRRHRKRRALRAIPGAALPRDHHRGRRRYGPIQR